MSVSITVALISLCASILVASMSFISSRIQATKQLENSEKIETLRHDLERDSSEKIETLRYELERSRSEEERGSKAKEILDHYRGPLLDAAWDLGHRIDGIREFNHMQDHGSAQSRWRENAIHSTLFRIAQYLAWVEILRCKVQFLNYEAPERTRNTFQLLEVIRRVFCYDELGDAFLLDREPQRAIGERMIKDGEVGETCIGYAEFSNLYEEKFLYWFHWFSEDLQRPGIECNERLAMLHTALAKLVDQLDQEKRYLHRGWRSRSPVLGLPPPRQKVAGPVRKTRLALNILACLFDVDGVLVDTVGPHKQAWQQTFDEFMRDRKARPGENLAPFRTTTDYHRYIDGRTRYDGVSSFLFSRGIELPIGEPSDPPGESTICALGNKKNDLVLSLLSNDGIRPLPGALDFLEAARSDDLRIAAVSASMNCAEVLSAAGMSGMVEVRVDGATAHERGLPGKPAPDMFLAAADQLGITPDHGAVFEDSEAGIDAGRAGGFGLVVGVNGAEGGKWLTEHGADLVVPNLGALLHM